MAKHFRTGHYAYFFQLQDVYVFDSWEKLDVQDVNTSCLVCFFLFLWCKMWLGKTHLKNKNPNPAFNIFIFSLNFLLKTTKHTNDGGIE